MSNRETKVSETKPLLIPVQAWADSMGLSVWTVRRMAYDGRVASVKLGKLLMIPAGEDERIIERGMRPAAA